MRLLFLSALLVGALPIQATAQDTAPDGTWGAINGLDSGDLAINGWDMIGTTALQAGPQTGLLVTFWRAANGTIARCVFSLVSASGSEQFETCSIAVPVNGESE